MKNKTLTNLLATVTSFGLLIVLGTLGANRANAASINYQNNDPSTRIATGIDDLDIGGKKYDIDFIHDTFLNVFGNPMVPGWKPPAFSGFRGQIQQGTIVQANNAIKVELNRGKNQNNNVRRVQDANSGKTRKYFITGGFVKPIQDEVKIFFNTWDSSDKKWKNGNITCSYAGPASQDCQNTYSQLFNSPFDSGKGLPYYLTQKKIMFAKAEEVPEPMTILGTIVAGGIGVAMKRKQKIKDAA